MKRRLEIEPLDKARWDRIERDLRDRLEHEPAPARRAESAQERMLRPALAFVLAGAAAAIVGAVAWEHLQKSPRVVTQLQPAPTRVETQDSPSHVDVGASSLDVDSHSVARIEGTEDTGVLVSLEHGAIECEVAPRHGRPPFVVDAGDVHVRVVGTHFRVSRRDGATHVSVQRGTVEVETNGATAVVSAGMSWPEASAIEPVDERSSPPHVVASAPLIKPQTAGSSNASASASAALPSMSSRERYDRAITLEATHPNDALAIYRELAAGSDSWAMTALYAEARLELERGNKDVARRRFAEYLQRYPTGPNANDARELSSKLQ